MKGAQVLPNERADEVTRAMMFEYFRGWGLKRRSRNMQDYERGKAWVQDLGLSPTGYFIAINYLAEYLMI